MITVLKIGTDKNIENIIESMLFAGVEILCIVNKNPAFGSNFYIIYIGELAPKSDAFNLITKEFYGNIYKEINL